MIPKDSDHKHCFSTLIQLYDNNSLHDNPPPPQKKKKEEEAIAQQDH